MDNEKFIKILKENDIKFKSKEVKHSFSIDCSLLFSNGDKILKEVNKKCSSIIGYKIVNETYQEIYTSSFIEYSSSIDFISDENRVVIEYKAKIILILKD